MSETVSVDELHREAQQTGEVFADEHDGSDL
jgi:hypothetical protein